MTHTWLPSVSMRTTLLEYYLGTVQVIEESFHVVRVHCFYTNNITGFMTLGHAQYSGTNIVLVLYLYLYYKYYK
jgi:hypothetical protein